MILNCISLTWLLTCAFHIPCTRSPETIDTHRGVCDNVWYQSVGVCWGWMSLDINLLSYKINKRPRTQKNTKITNNNYTWNDEVYVVLYLISICMSNSYHMYGGVKIEWEIWLSDCGYTLTLICRNNFNDVWVIIRVSKQPCRLWVNESDKSHKNCYINKVKHKHSNTLCLFYKMCGKLDNVESEL